MRRLLGVITRGSLTEGLEMKLADDCSIEDIKAGKFVVVDGDKLRFFSLITDVRQRLAPFVPNFLAYPVGHLCEGS